MLLDTNVIIDFLRGKPEAVRFIRHLTAKPAISVVTVAEIFAGLRSQDEELAARGLFGQCKIIGLTPSIAETGGVAMRHFRASHGMDFADALIAATAEHHGLELATLNVKHFPMFPKLKPAY